MACSHRRRKSHRQQDRRHPGQAAGSARKAKRREAKAASLAKEAKDTGASIQQIEKRRYDLAVFYGAGKGPTPKSAVKWFAAPPKEEPPPRPMRTPRNLSRDDWGLRF